MSRLLTNAQLTNAQRIGQLEARVLIALAELQTFLERIENPDDWERRRLEKTLAGSEALRDALR